MIDKDVLKEKENFIAENIGDAVGKLSNKSIAEVFYRRFEYSFCWGSNAIEGNTLTLEQTVSIIQFDEVIPGHRFSEHREALSLYRAIRKYLDYWNLRICEEWIKDVACEITGLEYGYRKENVVIASPIKTVYTPTHWEKIEAEMKDFIGSAEPPAEMSIGEKIKHIALKHIEFERIHPFLDGNGRTGRMILNQSLINSGLLPITIKPSSDYRSAFKRFEKNGETFLMEKLICNAEIDAIRNVGELTGKMGDVK